MENLRANYSNNKVSVVLSAPIVGQPLGPGASWAHSQNNSGLRVVGTQIQVLSPRRGTLRGYLGSPGSLIFIL